MNVGEPRCAVIIGERNAVLDFFDGGWRVEIIRIEKDPTQAPGDQFPDGALPCSGGSHDKDDHDVRRCAEPLGATQNEKRDLRRNTEANGSAHRAETSVHVKGGVRALQRRSVKKLLRSDSLCRSEQWPHIEASDIVGDKSRRAEAMIENLDLHLAAVRVAGQGKFDAEFRRAIE